MTQRRKIQNQAPQLSIDFSLESRNFRIWTLRLLHVDLQYHQAPLFAQNVTTYLVAVFRQLGPVDELLLGIDIDQA
jgi:hypothetical protein